MYMYKYVFYLFFELKIGNGNQKPHSTLIKTRFDTNYSSVHLYFYEENKYKN